MGLFHFLYKEVLYRKEFYNWTVKSMSIKKRLLLSNICMIIIPVLSFLLIDILLVYFITVALNGSLRENLNLFLTLRLVGLLIVLVVTNGLLTYFVSKSIIVPIQQLASGAKEIAQGNLDFSIKVTGKDEISQLAENFEIMRKKLKETEDLNRQYEENRKELIASISHDLKTPITSIKGYVNGMRDGVANTPEKMERYIDTVANKASQLDQLIDELFLYSKLSLNKVPFYNETMDLHAYFQDYIEELRFDLAEKRGEVGLYVKEGESFKVRADRNQLNRVINNVVQNSLKYTDKEKPEINVHLSHDGGQVKVQITDNGSGINRENLSRIFEQFYRGDVSRNSATGGSGIGLAIVKEIIEGHGGTVWAESEEGMGTSIFFTLPRAGDEK